MRKERMKRNWAVLILLAIVGIWAAAQQSPSASSAPPPSGTRTTETHTEAIVKPKPKPVKITPSVVRQAQTELNKRGYDAGPVDGIYGPRTRAAVAKFQADESLAQTGQLDLNTMSKLNVGGGSALSAAPSDVGRGGKAFGHDIKEGHPVAAGKALGSGAVSSGKKVAKGTESLAKEGAEKVGSGMSKAGRKIEGKAEGQPKQNPPQSDQNLPPKR
jgi:peptidoglycan hydrolase-like protein with peptidoglycan-binding domain